MKSSTSLDRVTWQSPSRCGGSGEPPAGAAIARIIGMTLSDKGIDWGQMLRDPVSFRTDPKWASHLEGFETGLGESMQFSRSEGPMHMTAYSAVDASRFISDEITQHLDDPQLTLEKKAHAELIRQIFGSAP